MTGGLSRDDKRRRPPRLSSGDRVAVIAPASPFVDPSELQRGLAALADLQLEPVLGTSVSDSRGYLAGKDKGRAADLMWALSDESIDAVWCARGGYGTQRVIAALPPEFIAEISNRPARPLVGFSDITVLHALVTHRLGWITFYGPNVAKLGERDAYTLRGVGDALFSDKPFTVAAHSGNPCIQTLRPGQAEGELAGGCLSMLAALAGTPLQVDFADRICFFEQAGQPASQIDRHLSQLLAAGCFENCRGILIGEHIDCQPEMGFGLESVFADLLGPVDVPCCFGLSIGHGTHQATLPIGASARLDADSGSLEICRGAVR